MSLTPADFTPADVAALEEALPTARADLEAQVVKQRAAIERHGATVAGAILASRYMDQLSQDTAAGLAALAVTRLAQQEPK